MQQNLTKLYEGANLSGAVPNLIYIPILFDCDLTEADVLTDAAVTSANAVFSLSKNGVNVPAAAVTINTGAKIGSVTGLDVALVKGDEIVLNLVSGAVSSPVTLNLATDDGSGGAGLPAGGTTGQILAKASGTDYDTEWIDAPSEGAALPAGDLSSTNKIEKLQDHPLSLPSLSAIVDDEFLDLSNLDYQSNVNVLTDAETAATLGGDVGEIYGIASGVSFATYAVPGAQPVSVNLRGFKLGSNEPQISIEHSTDNVNWTSVATSNANLSNLTTISGPWQYYDIIVPLITGASFIRIKWNGASQIFHHFVGRFRILPISLTDKAVILYDLPNNTFRNFTLPELKAALNALP